jgi:hypothetical protein
VPEAHRSGGVARIESARNPRTAGKQQESQISDSIKMGEKEVPEAHRTGGVAKAQEGIHRQPSVLEGW